MHGQHAARLIAIFALSMEQAILSVAASDTDVSTESLTKAELHGRFIHFAVIFAAGGLLLLVCGASAVYYKNHGRLCLFATRSKVSEQIHQDAHAPDFAALAIHEQEGIYERHAAWLSCRKALLGSVFIAYVTASVGLPIANFSKVSCSNGFWWETHAIFLALAFGTKFVELGLFVIDPTLRANVSMFGFAIRFFPSILSFADGYTDAVAVGIALSCDSEAKHRLGEWMAWTYFIGVVVLQWIVVAAMAWLEPTQACFMKVVHFDVLSACITLHETSKGTWIIVNLVRTFAEDLPQCILQLMYFVQVQQNYVILLSASIGAMTSAKASYDAIRRSVPAMGWSRQQELEEPQKSESSEASFATSGFSIGLYESGRDESYVMYQYRGPTTARSPARPHRP